MPHGDFLFPDSCHELTVNLDAAGDGRGWCLVLEYPAHMVEEPSGGQHDRGRFQTVPAVQEELSIRIPLAGGLGKPVSGLFLVVFLQVQFAEGILGVLIPNLSRLGY